MSQFKITIANQITLGLTINDTPIPINEGQIRVEIIENVITKLPTAKITIKNEYSGEFMKTYDIGDGSKVKIEIGSAKDIDEYEVSNWTVLGAPDIEHKSDSADIVILCILDKIKYLLARVPKSYVGNSSDVIKEIASECGLETVNNKGKNSVDSTLDKDTWRPPRMNTYSSFVKFLTDYAYFNTSSAFSSGVDEFGTLYFKNLDNIIKTEPIATFGHVNSGYKEPFFLITDFLIKNIGTMNNTMGGYRTKVGQENLDGTYTEIKETEVGLNSTNLELNKQIVSDLTESKFEYVPPDCGNVSNSRVKAKYQNLRIKNTYSTIVPVLVDRVTGLNLFSYVNLYLRDSYTKQNNEMYSGKYIVGSKTKIITGSNYAEKIVLVTQGRNRDQADKTI